MIQAAKWTPRLITLLLAKALFHLTKIGHHDIPLYVALRDWIEDETECRATKKPTPQWMNIVLVYEFIEEAKKRIDATGDYSLDRDELFVLLRGINYQQKRIEELEKEIDSVSNIFFTYLLDWYHHDATVSTTLTIRQVLSLFGEMRKQQEERNENRRNKRNDS